MASDTGDGKNGTIDWNGLAAAIPPRFFLEARWFRHKTDAIRRIRFFDGADLTPFGPGGRNRLLLLLLRVELASGAEVLYQAPLRLVENGPVGEKDGDDAFPVGLPGAAASDAVGSGAFQTAFRRLMDEGATLPGRHGSFRFERLPDRAPRQCRRLAQTSTNSLALVRGDDVVKHLRCLTPGVSPELEIGRFFAARGTFPHVPPLTGSCSYLGDDGREHTLAVSHRFIENEGDLWEWTQSFLRSYLPACAEGPAESAAAPPSSLDYLEQTAALAEVLAAMHRTLGQDGGDPAFRPEPVTREDLGQWAERMRRSAGAVFDRLAARPAPAAGAVGEFLARLPAVRAEVLAAFAALPGLDPAGWGKGRVHGDFHLGQALKTSSGFVVMDFEGEPLADPAQRRQRHSPYKDVAGLLRSYNYAAFAALFAWRDACPPMGETRWGMGRSAALAWNRAVERVFRQRYDQAAGVAPTPDLDRLVSALKLEKAVYELDYEINNRPGWVEIPLSGIETCLTDFRP